jgi:hypothetical protein
MAYKIDCPHCKSVLNVTEKTFGKSIPCPVCNGPIAVAESPEPSPPPTLQRATAMPPRAPVPQAADYSDATPLAFLTAPPAPPAPPSDSGASIIPGRTSIPKRLSPAARIQWAIGGGVAVIGAVIMLIFLLPSASSLPTERFAEKCLRERVERPDGPAKLVGFHKTDGQSGSIAGVPFYVMFYEAEYEFTRDGSQSFFTSYKIEGVGTARKKGELVKTDGSIMPAALEAPIGQGGGKKGERVKTRGELDFFKTESGWKLDPVARIGVGKAD